MELKFDGAMWVPRTQKKFRYTTNWKIVIGLVIVVVAILLLRFDWVIDLPIWKPIFKK